MPLVDLKSIITQDGFTVLAKSIAEGSTLQFTSVGLGTANYDPTQDMDALKEEQERFPVTDSRRTVFDAEANNAEIHVSAVADSEKEYDIGELGIYTNTGVLFSILSRAGNIITRKVRNDTILLGAIIAVSPEQADSIKVELGERLNLFAGDVLTQTLEQVNAVNDRISALERRLAEMEDKQR